MDKLQQFYEFFYFFYELDLEKIRNIYEEMKKITKDFTNKIGAELSDIKIKT